MKRLDLYLLRAFLPIFIGGIAFFVLALELADLIPNLWKFLTYDPAPADIGRMILFYVPKCVSYSLPVALLFAVSYSLGDLYSKNELVAVFTSGVSLYRFIMPLFLLGILLSSLSFFFEDRVVIDATRQKVELSRVLLKQPIPTSNSNVTVMSRNGRVTYQVGFYNDQDKSLSSVTIVKRSLEGRFVSRVNADRATWDGKKWVFPRADLFAWAPDGSRIVDQSNDGYADPDLDEPPQTFMKSGFAIGELKVGEARRYIEQLKRAGFPYSAELAEYYKRFSFALTPLIVMLLSCTLGGRFRKNILIMSLASSVLIAMGYYILQMVTMLMASFGFIPPAVGAWSPFVLFSALAVVMFKYAKT